MADTPTQFAIRDEDREILKAALTKMRDNDERPYIPLNVDLDGDGTADAWTLDDSGEVILVPDIPLEHTSYESVGGTTEVGEVPA